MRKAMWESREGGERRKRERWDLAAAFLAAAQTSSDRSGGGEVGGGGARRWVAAGGSRLCPCRPERSDAGASFEKIVPERIGMAAKPKMT
jgi:hypothetical protein